MSNENEKSYPTHNELFVATRKPASKVVSLPYLEARKRWLWPGCLDFWACARMRVKGVGFQELGDPHPKSHSLP